MRLIQHQASGSKRVIAVIALLLATIASAQADKQNDKADEAAPPPGWLDLGPHKQPINHEDGREVQCHTYFNSDDQGQLIIVITDALKKDSAASRYRVSWFILFPDFQYEGTTVYDRDEHSVRLYESVNDESGGHTSHTLFTKVTDDLILKLAADYTAGKYNNSDKSVRSLLSKSHCNTYELSH